MDVSSGSAIPAFRRHVTLLVMCRILLGVKVQMTVVSTYIFCVLTFENTIFGPHSVGCLWAAYDVRRKNYYIPM
jgi:hypothetical protein